MSENESELTDRQRELIENHPDFGKILDYEESGVVDVADAFLEVFEGMNKGDYQDFIEEIKDGLGRINDETVHDILARPYELVYNEELDNPFEDS